MGLRLGGVGRVDSTGGDYFTRAANIYVTSVATQVHSSDTGAALIRLASEVGLLVDIKYYLSIEFRFSSTQFL